MDRSLEEIHRKHLAEWCDFCEGKEDFDTSHFYTLFMEIKEEEFFKEVFKYFPNTVELMHRMNNFIGFIPINIRCKEVKNLTEDVLTNLVLADLAEKKKACIALGENELVDIIDSAVPEIVNDIEIVVKAREGEWHRELLSIVGEHLLDCQISQELCHHALFEAYYGLTNSYEMVWYLGRPLINTEMNLDIYFELTGLGGNYALIEGKILIAGLKASVATFG